MKLFDFVKKYNEKKAHQDSINMTQGSSKNNKKIPHLDDSSSDLKDDPQSKYSEPENTVSNDIKEEIGSPFQVIGQETVWKIPTRIKNHGFISKSVSTKETNHGLERLVEKPLIVSACGKVVKEADIGSVCSVCGQYEAKEQTFLCHYCGRALCIVDTHFFRNEEGKNIPFCSAHYKKMIDNINTWNFRDREIRKR